jgi:hypothetical protein
MAQSSRGNGGRGTPPKPAGSNPVAADRQQDTARRSTESAQAKARRDYSRQQMGRGGVARRTY